MPLMVQELINFRSTWIHPRFSVVLMFSVWPFVNNYLSFCQFIFCHYNNCLSFKLSLQTFLLFIFWTLLPFDSNVLPVVKCFTIVCFIFNLVSGKRSKIEDKIILEDVYKLLTRKDDFLHIIKIMSDLFVQTYPNVLKVRNLILF